MPLVVFGGLKYHAVEVSRLFAGNASTLLLQMYCRLRHHRRRIIFCIQSSLPTLVAIGVSHFTPLL